jgi:hypothetical protein
MYVYLLERAAFQKVHKRTCKQVCVVYFIRVCLEAEMATVIQWLPPKQIVQAARAMYGIST